VARERRQVLISPGRLAAAGDPGVLGLEAAETHYLARVLRYRPGDRVAVINGCGALWSASLEAGERLRLEQPLDRPLQRAPFPLPPLRLALAVPKREAELVWRMATELGADRLLPLLAERRAVHGDLPLGRWLSIVTEAAEQCERLWLPDLEPPAEARQWLARPPEGVGLVAVSRRPGLPPLGRYLADLVLPSAAAGQTLNLAIGPEGGWTSCEEGLALEAGWQPVSLGEGILRTSTAAVAAVALLASWRELSCASFPSPSP